uniref:Uncharacterized protein n=1 Tax=Ditylum brightwellii TaxID=49249 RepID=A0A6U3SM98_9STRA|mmetsp:Transcript_6642/g.10031  ORF Transcript_6642/g.10031 Transcript_6642/m.10031 type:complete len:259 (+) Transcript_6642:97-873(+)
MVSLRSCLKGSFPFKSKKLQRHIRTEAWSLVCKRCESHPKEAMSWSKQNGFYEGNINTSLLPIHVACAANAPLAVFESLLQAYPESISSKESMYGRVPLHLACIYGASLDVLKLLLSYSAKGAQEMDSTGRTPMFYLMTRDPSLEAYECLYEANPDGLKDRDMRGWLPIHVACHLGASDDIVLRMLESYPDSMNIRTAGGTLPQIKESVLTCWEKGGAWNDERDDLDCERQQSIIDDDDDGDENVIFRTPSNDSSAFV